MHIWSYGFFQVKAARAAGVLNSFGVDCSVGGGSSGGEEVSKILEEARAKYGRVTTSFKSGLDKADISFIPPPRTKEGPVSTKQRQSPPPQTLPCGTAESDLGKTESTDMVGGDTTDFKEVLGVLGTLKTKAQPRPKRRKLSKDAVKKIRQAKENVSNIVMDEADDDVRKDDHEINVNIPISDTTDVRIKVKPLDNQELRSQRIHVRVNQRKTPSNKIKSRSRHIAYGSKNVVSHHLRKTRPPLFSKKPPTPKLDRKQVLERVVSEVKKKRAKEEFSDQEISEVADDASKVKNFQIQAQKVLREKRTKNAQFRKLMQKL